VTFLLLLCVCVCVCVCDGASLGDGAYLCVWCVRVSECVCVMRVCVCSTRSGRVSKRPVAYYDGVRYDTEGKLTIPVRVRACGICV